MPFLQRHGCISHSDFYVIYTFYTAKPFPLQYRHARLRAGFRFLRETRQHGTCERDARPYQRCGLLVHDLELDLPMRERRFSFQTLVDHRRERINVLRRLRLRAHQLFRRHVEERATRELASRITRGLIQGGSGWKMAENAEKQGVWRGFWRGPAV